MKKSRFSDGQIMDALKRVEAGLSVPDVCLKGCALAKGACSAQGVESWLRPLPAQVLPISASRGGWRAQQVFLGEPEVGF